MKRNPVLWIMAGLAVAHALIGSAALAEVVPPKWMALATAVIVALDGVAAAWARSQVTPVADPKDNQGVTLVPKNGAPTYP